MDTAKKLPLARTSQNLGYKSINERRTPELIFAFVEPIGGGAYLAIDAFKRRLHEAYGYENIDIPMSSIIEKEAGLRGLPTPDLHDSLRNAHPSISPEAKRIDELQQLGNILRENEHDFLAKRAIRKINKSRMSQGMEKQVGNAAPAPKPKRIAHFIRTIKHKEELRLLQSVYGGLLHIIAVSADYEKRINNFHAASDGNDETEKRKREYDILAKIDQKEDIGHGQQVRDVFHKANLFLNSDKDLNESIDNFLQLLFGEKIGSPTNDERMMFEAFGASLRSTCLSRQVGAAICDSNGELVSVGWNDIPAVDGGLATDRNERQRKTLCKNKAECRSDTEKKELLKELFAELKKEKLLLAKTNFAQVEKVLEDAGISGLIEFSRAIHAEMEAILSAARTARRGLKGGTIFVTTYPCDNCAKHIIATGIRRIVYIEPYTKSRATDFFPECLAEENLPKNDGPRVVLSQFIGISHPSYHLLFRKIHPRKRSDGFHRKSSLEALPITSPYLDSFALYETKIVEAIDDEQGKTSTTSL